MKTTVIVFLIIVSIVCLGLAEKRSFEGNECEQENQKLKKELRQTEQKLLQCADCCNQMNIRMSEWYVRKDSIIYDFYLRNTKQ